MVSGVNQTYAIYTYIEPLCCTPKTNMFCQLYLNFKMPRKYKDKGWYDGKNTGPGVRRPATYPSLPSV